MAQRNFCDRCGEEIEGVVFKLKAGIQEYDLCPSCKSAFETFLKADTIQHE